MFLALSIIENCPPNEIEEKCQMLLNVFNTRGTLLPLLRATIDHEVTSERESVVFFCEPNLTFKSDSTAMLFRSNDMRNLLLTAFCKKYGVNYLRRILSPLVDAMAAQPDQSYEIDPMRTSVANVAENLEVVKTLTNAFLSVILNSVNAMPP